MRIWLDFEGGVVDGHFVFVRPVAADIGQSVIWRCSRKLDCSEEADDVVFVLEVEFQKPDVSIGERVMEFRRRRSHVVVGIDEDISVLGSRRLLRCILCDVSPTPSHASCSGLGLDCM